MMKPLKAPFPFPGGKSKIVADVWTYLGDVESYCEPFCGSAAVLLARPSSYLTKTETINDSNGFLANFWRAVQADATEVVKHADWPVNEIDMRARHVWLLGELATLLARLIKSPTYYNAKIAGWWVWGCSASIVGNWCIGKKRGGVDGVQIRKARPQLGNAYGRGSGVHSNDRATTCEERTAFLMGWLQALQDRLRSVRVCCGDWERVCKSKSVLLARTPTGVFLDPPYDYDTGRHRSLYLEDNFRTAKVTEWCQKWGSNPQIRVVLCGLEGEHDKLLKEGWDLKKWSATGNYQYSDKERLWISPYCLSDSLFT